MGMNVKQTVMLLEAAGLQMAARLKYCVIGVALALSVALMLSDTQRLGAEW